MQHVLPKTGVYLVDAMLGFMMSKAKEKLIQFDVKITDTLNSLINNVLTQGKLETLTADLLENAIISMVKSEYRRIFVSVSKQDCIFEISVSDSGIPFEIDTLYKLGREKSSTHTKTGGQGIGFMTLFEILQEVSASLIISEPRPIPHEMTKSVAIRFDGKADYIVRSYRADEIKAQGAQYDMSRLTNVMPIC